MIRWWRADGVVLNGSSQVTSVTDRTANADQLVQLVTPQAHVASDARYGGKPSCTLVNASAWFATSAVTYGAFTVFVVGQGTLASYYWYGNGGTDYIWLDNNIAAFGIARTAGSCTRTTATASWGITAAAKTYTTVFDGTRAGFKQYLNGVDQAATNVSGTDPGVVAKTQSWTIRQNGSFAEIIICNSALSAARIAQFEAYLQARYAHY